MMYRDIKIASKFCESLREHAMKMITFKKKNTRLLTKNSKNHMKVQNSLIFVRKNKYAKDKKLS